MVAPDAMDDLGMTDSSELVEMFGCRGDRVEIPEEAVQPFTFCLLYTSPSPRDLSTSRMPSSA